MSYSTTQKTIRIADGLRVIVDDNHEDFIDKDGNEFSWNRVCDCLKITGIIPQGVIDDLFRKLFAFGYLDLTEAYGGAYKVVRVEMIPPSRAEDRCRDCMYLVEDDDGNWVCDDCGMNIHEIADDECSANQEW